MIWLALPTLLAAQAAPDRAVVRRGAEIFNQTCAVAYCHGPEGSPGRAPQLAGRRFEHNYLLRVTTEGVPQTSMPGFRGQLKPEEVDAVVRYVLSLGAWTVAPTPAPAAAAKPGARSPEASRGKDLFFDPGRMGSCGTCHLVEGLGVAIGPGLKAAPEDVATLRGVLAKRVRTAQPRGEESFPALIVEQGRLYDLSSPLPVLRFFADGEVALKDGSGWSHAAATRLYSDEELGTIVAYLRSLAPK